MKYRLFYIVLVGLWAGACGPSGEKPRTDGPAGLESPAAAPADTVAAVRAQALSRLSAYYDDLAREQVDVSAYYAPVVERFFNAKDLPREQVGQSLQRGFETVSDRRIQLESESLTLSPATGGGYVAEFGGSMTFVRTADGSEQAQTFRNRVTFDADWQIVRYESLDSGPQPGTREVAPATSSGPEAIAKVILAEFGSGRIVRTPQYIHPSKGFYFLTHPGAVHIPYRCTRVDEVYAKAPWLKEGMRLAAAPQPGPLPDFDCGKLFSKAGCFMAPVQTAYDDISSLMQTLQELDLGRYEANDIALARDVEQYVTHQLVDTEAAVAFYFGQIDGAWYLLIIDIGSYDCSA